jgi:signal transduction histidine kinase
MLSIRTRFLLVSIVSVTLSLSLATWFFIGLFSTNLAERIDRELTGHINMLAGMLSFGPDGKLQRPDGPRDNRFHQVYGGLYWQIIDPATGLELRSESLFDYALPLPDDVHMAGTVHRYRLKGPEERDVIVQERLVLLASPSGSQEVRLAVAINASELDETAAGFGWTILPYVAALGVFLVIMSAVQLYIGLQPLTAMAKALEALRQRRETHLAGRFPGELSSIVRQLNSLLEAQEKAMQKARARAADLAHGLKTPLTIISNNILKLEEKGESQIAEELDMVSSAMLAHINHELARTRIAQNPDLRRSDADCAQIASEVIRTLKHTEWGERLEFALAAPETLMLPIDPNDLRELLGNLLENACKWAKSSVSVKAIRTGSQWLVTIEDDGPGVPEEKLPDLIRRGTRLDLRTPGTGLGLAIVNEIAEVYGIILTFETLVPSGFRASLLFSAK